jgi:hypothetical protein
MADHVISPDLFEVLDEYIGALEDGEAIVDDVVPQASKVVVFTENAFGQFFENEVGVEIKGFDETAMEEAARARKAQSASLSPQAKRLITLFTQFCEQYDDVKSASYGGHGSVLKKFHSVLLVRLLQRIGALAKANGDGELEKAAGESLDRLKEAIDVYPWSDHDRRREEDE